MTCPRCNCLECRKQPDAESVAALNYTLRNWLVSRQNRVPETAGERETV